MGTDCIQSVSSEKCFSIVYLKKEIWGLEYVVLDIYLIENIIEYCMYNFFTAGNPSALPQDRPIEWCTISHPEQQKCDKISSLIPLIKCQRASSVEECIKKIKVLLGHMDEF